jgi:hypothetical protein
MAAALDGGRHTSFYACYLAAACRVLVVAAGGGTARAIDPRRATFANDAAGGDGIEKRVASNVMQHESIGGVCV